MAASLRAAGLSELVADDGDDYERQTHRTGDAA